MIIWQVNWDKYDHNHKLFVLAKSRYVNGKTTKSSSIVTFDYANGVKGRGSYYFYLEIIK